MDATIALNTARQQRDDAYRRLRSIEVQYELAWTVKGRATLAASLYNAERRVDEAELAFEAAQRAESDALEADLKASRERRRVVS